MRILLFLLFLSSLAFAEIATVVDIVGDATLQRSGKSMKVFPKLQLKEHDTIQTGKNAKVKIFFKDATAVSLGKNTSFEIDKYLYTGKKNSEIKFKVLKGFFKTVTGKIAKVAPNRFKLQTKNATIGIRGTVFAFKTGGQNDVILCTDGKIILFTPSGDIEVDAGSKAVTSRGSLPKVKQYSEAEKKALIKNAGWHGSMSLKELIAYIKANFKEPLRSQLLATLRNILEKDSTERALFGAKNETVNADDVGFIDDITINGREFESLEQREIEFYPEDLQDGKVVVEGLLESEDKAIPLDSLFVEITTDGGDTWTRAQGNANWEWSFRPEIEKNYEFSVRVVRDIKSSQGGLDDLPVYADSDEQDIDLSQTLSIGGFKLTLNENVSTLDGKISGSGQIEIPYLKDISTLGKNTLDVDFSNLTIENGIVSMGDIEYNHPFAISTPIADLNIRKIVFSPIASHNKIEGKLVYKGQFASEFGTYELPSTSKFLPTNFALSIPFTSKTLGIWPDKGVELVVGAGSLNISYALGDALPRADFTIPSAQFKLGQLLKYADGSAAQVLMQDFGRMPTLRIPKKTYLLDTGIELPRNMNVSFNLSDYSNPSLTFTSSVNLDSYVNSFAKNLHNASISVAVSNTGFSATITADGGLDPVTILDRGGENKDVKLVFTGDHPSLTLALSNADIKQTLQLHGISAELHFGDLLQKVASNTSGIVAPLGDISTPHLNIQEPLYLLGSKIKLPHGFHASVDLSDMNAPTFDFDLDVDFEHYDNFIAKKLSGAKIVGSLSKNGFSADVTATKPAPITIYEPEDVKLKFIGESGPSFHIAINGSESLPQLHLSGIEAELDFGTLLQSMSSEAGEHVIATVGVLSENKQELLSLQLPAKVKLLNSNLAFEGILAKLSLSTKEIDVKSSVDLSAYDDNPVLEALNGSSFNFKLSRDGIEGNIVVEDPLEPINIWSAKDVVLTINGKPSVGVIFNSDGVKFNFGELDASLDFGTLLETPNHTSVKALLKNAANNLGSYSVTLQNKAYLLGSNFALENLNIVFNPNVKTLSFSSSADLSQYTNPIVKAFNGAAFTAKVSSSGFSGTLTKEGSLDPIVILQRGGAAKNVSLEFTGSPTVSVAILNSGIDFGFTGGGAKLHFGDFLGGAELSLVNKSKGIYSWSLTEKTKLFTSAKAYISDIKNAKVNIVDIENPIITFDANIDLSSYGGIFSSVKNVKLANVILSKEGFSAKLTPTLGTINIWKEKHVSVNFTKNPEISLSVDSNGFGIGFSKLHASLDFGDLLPSGSIATIGDTLSHGANDLMHKGTKQVQESTGGAYTWYLEGSELPLAGTKILLSGLGGSLDLSDFSNPSITLNATANLKRYADVFRYVSAAGLNNVVISKNGLSGTLVPTITEIPIWRDKNVKITFDKSPKFHLGIDSNGLKVSAKDLSAKVHLGSLLNESVASLTSSGGDIYKWSLDGKNELADTNVFLSKLKGSIDFSSLKDPKLLVSQAKADLVDLGTRFNNVSLQNAEISKHGFIGDLSVKMDDISLYSKDDKKVDLKFADDMNPTLHLELTRHFKIGISNLKASIKFTNMLHNEELALTPHIVDGVTLNSVYSWGLDNTYNLINDENGNIPVTNIGGTIDLSDWSNPIVSFHTTADFTHYHLVDFGNLGVVEITKAEIQKTKIEWNLEFNAASAQFTILEMGSGENDDVRVALRDVSGVAGSDGNRITGGDGTLYFGKLFDGNKEVGLTLTTSGTGLKTYSFALDPQEEVIYKKDDNNFISFTHIGGSLIEISPDHYKVALTGKGVARSSALNALSIGALNITTLEIGSSGFAGDISATLNGDPISILEDKVSLSISEIGVHIDSSDTAMPIKLSTFDGNLDLKELFDGNDAKAALSFVSNTSSIAWNFPTTKTLYINGNYEFKHLSGNLNLSSLDNLSVGVSGDFSYKNINKTVTLDNFRIGTTGIFGTVSLNDNINIFNHLNLTKLSVTFAGLDTSGEAAMRYTDNSFLSTGKKIDLGMSATVDSTGIKDFSVDGDLSSIDIPDFAVFKFTKASASTSMSNFWVKLDGTVKPQNDLFSADVELAFKDLKISASGVSIGSAAVDVETNGAKGSLAGLSMEVRTIGIGFDTINSKSLFYVHAIGGLSLEVAQADADVKIYSDKTIDVQNIDVSINKSGLVTNGTLTWYKNDAVYGNGFKATLDLSIAEIFSASGLLRIGQKGDVFYWMANASGGIGGGIPFGALTFYQIGGGIGYHMIYDETKKDFIPDGHTMSLMLNTYMGTSADGGYLWNGKIDVIAAIRDGNLRKINMIGDSWVLSEKYTKPAKRKISATITYATSPKSLHIAVDASVEYHSIIVNGSMDAMFSSSEQHVYLGTDKDYGYAFNIDHNLGHVRVSLFGIDANGFFMVNRSALAFGQGIRIDKHWSKDWWGPDPSLSLLLVADSKALLVYRPRFQMNLDIYVEVDLEACYGGCIDVGADVLLKLATPDPNYLYAKTRVHVYGTSITFKGYIYGSGTLQTESERPSPEIFDKIAPLKYDTSVVPSFKIYSKFAKSQPVEISMHNLKLKKVGGNNVGITIKDLPGSEEQNGVEVVPTRVLARNTEYELSGTMNASFSADGKTETASKEFSKRFKTRSTSRVEFTDIIESVKPANNKENVHEDTGVTIKYNKEMLQRLGGINSSYVRDYKINLYDADDNFIPGHFTPPDEETMVAKFQSTKALRVYRYCVNEEGEVRETFILNGHFLNPFNGFRVDNGNIALSVDNSGLGTQRGTNISLDNSRYGHGDIAIQTDTQSQENASTTTANIHNGTNNMHSIRTDITIPTYIKRSDIVLKSPEALGELVITSQNDGKSYAYYRANQYTIKIKYKNTTPEVYKSTFKIEYNNIAAEAKRKVEQMGANLEPILTVGFDENRVGSGNIRMADPDAAKGYFNEVRTKLDDGLLEIGVRRGIKTKTFLTLTYELKQGGSVTKEFELNNRNAYLYGYQYSTTVPGIVRDFSARIQYISTIDNSVVLEKEISNFVQGDPFNIDEEAADRRMSREERENAIEHAKRGSQGGGKVGVPSEGGAIPGESPGGFEQVGGGMNPAGGFSVDADFSPTEHGGFGLGTHNYGAHGVHGASGASGFGAKIIVDVGR